MLNEMGFGIYVFSLPGWGLMLFLILIECAMMSEFVRKTFFNQTIFITTIISNFISAILGLIASMILTSGKWLVFWFPWVGAEDVQSYQLYTFMLYFLLASIGTIFVEILSNYLLLRHKYRLGRIVRATIITNIVSILCGSTILYIISFL